MNGWWLVTAPEEIRDVSGRETTGRTAHTSTFWANTGHDLQDLKLQMAEESRPRRIRSFGS